MVSQLTQDSDVSLELKRMFYQLKLSQPETKEFSTLMITSANDGEGKSVFSLAMALGIAKEKEKDCLLVDANWMNPVIHEYFGITRKHNLEKFWQAPLDCIQPSGIEHLDVLAAPIGVEVDTQEEFVKSEVIRELFDKLSANYASVIFDTSPILKNIQQYGGEPGARNLDSLILSDFVQISILVIMARVTNKQMVKKAKFELQKDNNQVWAVLNNYKNPFYK
jgi:protein-tyrosine kinase